MYCTVCSKQLLGNQQRLQEVTGPEIVPVKRWNVGVTLLTLCQNKWWIGQSQASCSPNFMSLCKARLTSWWQLLRTQLCVFVCVCVYLSSWSQLCRYGSSRTSSTSARLDFKYWSRRQAWNDWPGHSWRTGSTPSGSAQSQGAKGGSG